MIYKKIYTFPFLNMYNLIMVYLKRLLIGLFLVFPVLSHAENLKTKEFISDPAKMKEASAKEMGKVSAMPDENWLYATTKKGERFLVSEDGRFVIKGAFFIVDTWAGKPLRNHKDISESYNYPMEKLEKELLETSHVTTGGGSKNVYAFVDPMDKKSVSAVNKAIILSKGKDIKLNFVYFPALGKKSRDFVTKMHCGTPSQRFNALKTGVVPYKASGCSFADVDRATMLSSLLKIKRIPYWVFPDGSHAVLEGKDLSEAFGKL